MFTFPFVLDRGEDPVTGMPVLGFQHAGQFIFDPYRSPDLTLGADPQSYGLTGAQGDQLVKLNKLLVRATRAALDAGSALIQQELGLAESTAADLQLTAEKISRPVVQTLADYVLREVSPAVPRQQ